MLEERGYITWFTHFCTPCNVVSFVSKEGFTRDDKILVWKIDLGAFYIFYKIL